MVEQSAEDINESEDSEKNDLDLSGEDWYFILWLLHYFNKYLHFFKKFLYLIKFNKIKNK